MKDFHKELHDAFQFYYYLGVYPFKISWISQGKTNKFIFSCPKTKFYYLWFIWAIINALQYFFIVVLFVVNIPERFKNKEFVQLTFHLFWIFSKSYAFQYHNFHYLKRSDVISFVNGTGQLNSYLKTKYSRISEFLHYPQLLTVLVCYGLYLNGLFVGVFSVMPIFLIFRNDTWHLGSLVYKAIIYKNSSLEILGCIVGAITEFWSLMNLWGVYTLGIFQNLVFLQSFRGITDYLILETAGSGVTLKQLEKVLSTYTKLRVLTTVYNNLYGTWYVAPMKSIFAVLFIFGAVITIKLFKMGNFIVTFSGIGMITAGISSLTIIMTFTSVVNKQSLRLQSLLRNRMVSGVLAKKFMKSYKVEAVRSGPFYDIQRITFITVLGLISNVTASLLMSIHV